MRAIHIAKLPDKVRPVVILTREVARPFLRRVTVAPITSTIRGIAVEIPVGSRNGLDPESVINCDNIQTIPKASLGRYVGALHDDQELALTAAIMAAFDLEDA